MRPLILLAVVALAACATPSVPCACQPLPAPAPLPEPWPQPSMDPQGEADLVVRAITILCPLSPDTPLRDRAEAAVPLGIETSTGEHRYPAQEAWMFLSPPTVDRPECQVVVTGDQTRLLAVDRALKASAEAQGLTWNIRDRPSGPTPGLNDRVRGMADRGEAVMRWQILLDQDPAKVTTLRLTWTAPVSPAD